MKLEIAFWIKNWNKSKWVEINLLRFLRIPIKWTLEINANKRPYVMMYLLIGFYHLWKCHIKPVISSKKEEMSHCYFMEIFFCGTPTFIIYWGLQTSKSTFCSSDWSLYLLIFRVLFLYLFVFQFMWPLSGFLLGMAGGHVQKKWLEAWGVSFDLEGTGGPRREGDAPRGVQWLPRALSGRHYIRFSLLNV